MQRSSLERLSPLTGVVGAALVLIAAMVVGLFSYLPPADEVADYLSSHASQVALGGYLGLLSTFFFIWFAGSLRSELRRHEMAGDGRLSDLAFAGGIVAGLVIGLGFTLVSAAAGRAGAPDGISAVGAVTLYDLSSVVEGQLYPIALAVMIEATAVVTFRHGAFPRWFGWVSSILAVILLSPFSYLGLYVAVLWVIVVSLWLYTRARSAV